MTRIQKSLCSDFQRMKIGMLLWLSKIPRTDFVPSERAVVCINHFAEHFVVTVDSVKRPDGTILTVERAKPMLTDDAYPSIFPNCPSYLSEEPPSKRKNPLDRHVKLNKEVSRHFQTGWKLTKSEISRISVRNLIAKLIASYGLIDYTTFLVILLTGVHAMPTGVFTELTIVLLKHLPPCCKQFECSPIYMWKSSLRK